MNKLTHLSFFIVILIANVFSLFAKDESVERIISLTPSGTEIIYELGFGSKIVARSDFCNYPEQVLEKESIGGFDGKSVSIEKIIEKNPDFVYLTSGMHDFLIPQLKNFGIKYYCSEASSIQDIFDEILEVGKIIGAEEKSKLVVFQLREEIEKLKKNNIGKQEKKKIYFEVYNAPFITCGKKSYLNEIIECANGINIFSDIDSAYPQVNEEQILIRNPDFIIASDYSQQQIDYLYSRKNWQNIKAIKNKKVFSVDSTLR